MIGGYAEETPGNSYSGYSLGTVHSSTDGSLWTPESPFPTAITQHTAVVLGSRLYVLGGITNDGAAGSDIFLSTGDGSAWRYETPLPAGFGVYRIRRSLY